MRSEKLLILKNENLIVFFEYVGDGVRR